ncbi:hypothetical protein [Streptomyces sp. NEAU-S7GS2]|uniref:hypothetical protein n=1 Tax=Streptomyces sp. NEAU-S7GS2 TaxID=2202000 RepID=UPI000D703983|nr:hypothetical protein [Streptomyces sp. NEAU-S7GS2]AWN24841.1 hypothetical protein DKG71_00415 [Streptomyces sp. NEAU-S7GS2]
MTDDREFGQTAISAAICSPEARRLQEEIRREETRLGLELRPRFQALQERYDRAVQDLTHDVLSRTCTGKHGRWGRICVLTVGHEATEPHWGTTAQGQPIAWVGTAPDDD